MQPTELPKRTQLPKRSGYRLVGWAAGLALAVAAGLCTIPSECPQLHQAITSVTGLPLPAKAKLLAHEHVHSTEPGALCRHRWLIQSPNPLKPQAADSRRQSQSAAEIQRFLETATRQSAAMEAAAPCLAENVLSCPAERPADGQEITWTYAGADCRLLQVPTHTGYFALLEVWLPY